MIVDESREYCLSNFAQFQKNKRVIETDHNGLILELSIEFCNRKPERKELFNLKNKICQEVFKEETENNLDLLNCFETDLPVEAPQIDDDLKQKNEERIKQIEMKIGSEVSGKHHEDVVETLKSLGGDKHCLDGAGRKKMWSLLKRKYPKMSPLLPVVTWV